VITPISSLSDPRVAEYGLVADPTALAARGLFVAEGRLVVRALVEGGRHRVRSLLLSPAALAALPEDLTGLGTLPVFVCPADRMRAIVGYNVSRGCLALADRTPAATLEAVVPASRPGLVVVLEGVANPDNVGGVFRSALAFGADAVLLGPGCGDPLYRKAIRVSIGATLRVPWALVPAWPAGLAALRTRGYRIAALTPRAGAHDLAAFAARREPGRGLALLAGAEGTGLSPPALEAADVHLRIAMVPGVDSLNLATAAAIALHRLSDRTG
jgi:tRNA G18 (ribose-2'-O)-methylase SpoU